MHSTFNTYSAFNRHPAVTASRKWFCLLVVLIAMQSNSVKAQYVYGAAGSPTPVPAFVTGLPVFDDPRPVLAIEFDDAVQWASEKKTDIQQQSKEDREKAKAKLEAQRNEAAKKETAKKETAEKDQAAEDEAALNQDKEAAKRKNLERELQLREPENRERAVDAWDQDLQTERPKQTQDNGPHQGWAPEAPVQMLRKVMEMRELRERLIREHGPEHPSIRPLNAALEEFERRQQGPRPEAPRHANQVRDPQDRGPQDRGPQDRGPQEHGPQEHGPQEHGPQDHNAREHNAREHNPREHNPREHGPREQAPRGHAPIGSVDELMHNIERLDRIIERLANEYRAIKNEEEEEDDDERDTIREKVQEMVELRLELRQRVKRFQVEMMRVEHERAAMETELFEQSLEAIHAVTVEEILQR